MTQAGNLGVEGNARPLREVPELLSLFYRTCWQGLQTHSE
jgi:hypothetical protein